MNEPSDKETDLNPATALPASPLSAEAASPQAALFAPSRHHRLGELLQLLNGVPPKPSGGDNVAERLVIGLRRVTAGQSLMHMGALATALYFVNTGTLKIARSDADGYEQVLGFAGRTDMLGYDALCLENHPTGAVALEDSTVFVVPKADLATYCQAEPAFELALHRAAGVALARSSAMVDVMAAVSSEVRLARFLLQLSQQMADKGLSPRHFILRMGRRDIASMLGVAHETVSRSFTSLALLNMLRVNDRDVEILDLAALRNYARSTRRGQEDAGAHKRPASHRSTPPGRHAFATQWANA